MSKKDLRPIGVNFTRKQLADMAHNLRQVLEHSYSLPHVSQKMQQKSIDATLQVLGIEAGMNRVNSKSEPFPFKIDRDEFEMTDEEWADMEADADEDAKMEYYQSFREDEGDKC